MAARPRVRDRVGGRGVRRRRARHGNCRCLPDLPRVPRRRARMDRPARTGASVARRAGCHLSYRSRRGGSRGCVRRCDVAVEHSARIAARADQSRRRCVHQRGPLDRAARQPARRRRGRPVRAPAGADVRLVRRCIPTRGGTLSFQFAHLLPALLAEAHNLGGDRLMFAATSLLSGVALLAFFVAAWRLVRNPFVALAALVSFAFLLPEVSFSRDTYSEIPMQVLIFTGLWILVDRAAFRRPRLALVAGLVLGMLQAARIDALAVLTGLAPLFAVVWLVADARDRRSVALSGAALRHRTGAGRRPGLHRRLVAQLRIPPRPPERREVARRGHGRLDRGRGGARARRATGRATDPARAELGRAGGRRRGGAGRLRLVVRSARDCSTCTGCRTRWSAACRRRRGSRSIRRGPTPSAP